MHRTCLRGGALSLVAAALLLLSAPALAQTQAQQWSGVYIGANVGAAINRDTGQNVCWNNVGVRYGVGCDLSQVGAMNAGGFIGGVQAGWNIQLGRLVFGPELDYDGSTLQQSLSYHGPLRFQPSGVGSADIDAGENMTSLQSERLRVGFATDRAMFYVTAGWAQANWTLSSNLVCYSCRPQFRFPGTTPVQRAGWTEGVGGEWAIGRRLAMKTELTLYSLQPYSTRYREMPFVGYTAGKDFYFHGATARLGVDWRL